MTPPQRHEDEPPTPADREAGPLIAAVPVAAAIFVFGTVYGAGASPLADPLLVVGSSALIYSGAAQFATVSLLATGAGLGAVVAAVATLNLRNVALGAVLRRRLDGGWPRRLLAGLVLLDETVGLAVAARHRPARVYAVAGVVCYVAWVSGTGVGVAVGAAAGTEALADALFPVLFVGLAAAAATSRAAQLRTVAAMAATALVAMTVPAATGVAAIAVALLAAVPGGRP